MVETAAALQSMVKTGREPNHELMDEVYQFICEYIRQNRISPSFKEIGEGCFMSQGNVVRYVDLLEAKGRITRQPGIPRSIALTES